MNAARTTFIDRHGQAILFAAFFLSGASGLIHEVVWTRLFSHVMGSSTYATCMVLSVFMGGLALGSYAGGIAIDRITSFSPLKAICILEGGIGLFALAMPFLIDTLQPIYARIYHYTDQAPALLALIRFGFSALILLVPTTFMGATLPIITRFFTISREQTATMAGRLYSINTFGAVAGSFSAGFWLLPTFGVWRTIVIAAAGNFLVCTVAYAFLGKPAVADGKTAQRTTAPAAKHGPAPRQVCPSSALTPSILLTGCGLSGFAALSYEVIWTRVMAMMVGSSTYAFTMILTAFVAGIALGSAICSRFVHRFKHPMVVLGALQIILGVTAFTVVPVLGAMPFHITGLIARHSSGFWELHFVEFAYILVIAIVPTLLMGAAFPLATRIFALHRKGIGESVGTVYGANTAGNILGSLITGFVLIPFLGTQKAIYVAVMMNMLSAMLFLSGSQRFARRPLKIAAIGAGVAVVGAAMLLVPAWNISAMTFGPFYEAVRLSPLHISSPIALKKIAAERRVLFHQDGPDTTVTVKEFPDGSRALYINGKPDASSHGDLPSQILVAHLPLMMHPNPQEALVIGLASGITLGTATLHPVSSIDCLEISPTMVAASHYFDDYNNAPLENSKVHLILEDGRNHLALTRKTYDVIISEPSNPYFAGMADLFTGEFFTLMREHLNPGGLACAWVQTYLIDKETFRSIVAAFHSVFPRMTLWKTLKGDCMMVGARDDLSVALPLLADRFNQPAIRADLERIDIRNLPDLLGHLLTGPHGVAELTAGAVIHTDDNLIAEFAAPKSLVGETVLNLSLIDALENVRQPDFSFIRKVENEDISSILREASDHVNARGMVYAFYARKREQNVEDFSLLKQAHALNPNDFLLHEALDRLSAKAFESYTHKRNDIAMQLYQQILSISPKDAKANYNLATLYRYSGNLDKALEYYVNAVDANPGYYEAHFQLAAMYARKRLPLLAKAHYETVLRLKPDFYPAMTELADLLLTQLRSETDAAKQALALAESASTLARHNDTRVLWTLLLAQEESGSATMALETAKRALPLARKEKNQELLKALGKKILYLQANR